MKRRWAFAALILLTLTQSKALAETSTVVEFAARNRPQGTNLLGTFRYDQLLWGKASSSDPLYGFYRFGASLGGSPTMAAFFEVAPIAPISFQIQRSRSHRFFNSNVFDCDIYECQGIVDRTDYKLKFVGAYQNLFLLGSVLWREIRTQESDRLIYLELENFAVTPGVDRYFENTLTLGYRLPDQKVIGVLENSGVISEGNQKFQSAYLFYQTPCHEYKITGAIGHYRSVDTDIIGFSAALAITRAWGESLSLW